MILKSAKNKIKGGLESMKEIGWIGNAHKRNNLGKKQNKQYGEMF